MRISDGSSDVCSSDLKAGVQSHERRRPRSWAPAFAGARLLDNARAVPISAGMTISADPRSFLYGLGLDPDAAIRLTAQALARADDGEFYLQYRKSESFGFDDGRLQTASYDTHSGLGLRAVSGEETAFAPVPQRVVGAKR